MFTFLFYIKWRHYEYYYLEYIGYLKKKNFSKKNFFFTFLKKRNIFKSALGPLVNFEKKKNLKIFWIFGGRNFFFFEISFILPKFLYFDAKALRPSGLTTRLKKLVSLVRFPISHFSKKNLKTENLNIYNIS